MSRKIRVYVAGPIRLGTVAVNLSQAIQAGDELWREGFAPYIPHANYIWEIMCPKTAQEWLEHDLNWLAVCDAVLRIPGESEGADFEVFWAKDNKIPVFYGIAALKLWSEGHEPV